jgi:hyperosmotically inducible periplasmic protein
MRKKSLFSLLAACAVLYVSNAYAQNADVPATAMASSSKAAMKTADRQTVRAVRKALFHAKGLRSAEISVFARSGVVTLTGSVSDASQIDRAGTIAAGVPHVTSVSNQLSVRLSGGQ